MKVILYLFLLLAVGCKGDVSESKESTMLLGKSTPKTYVISSPLSGVLMADGKPLANTPFTRKLRWNGNEDGVMQQFTTDAQGHFSLPAHEEELALGALEEFVGKTDLIVEHNGEADYFWFASKRSAEINSEFDAVPEAMVCDLNEADLSVNLAGGLCLTKCRWTNMPEQEDPNAL